MGCQFGVVNVSLHKEAVMMSQNTIDPIRFVPRIILYINGRPYMAYRGPHDGGEIRRFIKEITDNLQKKQQFSGGERVKDGTPIQQVNSPTTGVPVCDDKVCYLDFGKAYNPKR
jgi:thioredoxin-like negative regulator of GroEL